MPNYQHGSGLFEVLTLEQALPKAMGGCGWCPRFVAVRNQTWTEGNIFVKYDSHGDPIGTDPAASGGETFTVKITTSIIDINGICVTTPRWCQRTSFVNLASNDDHLRQPRSEDGPLVQWEEYGHKLEGPELEALKRSIVEMALSPIEGQDNLFVGGIWALRRSDTLEEKGITHILSVVGFSPDSLKNFRDEPWSEYGKKFRHLLIDIDDVAESDLLAELPAAIKFIDEGLRGQPSGEGTVRGTEQGMQSLNITENSANATGKGGKGGVFVHCAAGKSRSVSMIVAYLLWRYPNRFDPNLVPSTAYGNISSKKSHQASAADATPSESSSKPRSRKETANEAIRSVLALIRRTRPMAEPNDGFMEQLALWWEMGCPEDVESHPLYQRWAYKREVEEHVAVGQAPSRLRFEDEQPNAAAATAPAGDTELTLRCKKCRKTLVTGPFINEHKPESPSSSSSLSYSNKPDAPCPHYFVEPLSWMRAELEKGDISGRLLCPNERCGAGVGRYDWKGIRCACGGWVTPGLSLQRARVDEELRRTGRGAGQSDVARSLGIRMPPGGGRGGGNL